MLFSAVTFFVVTTAFQRMNKSYTEVAETLMVIFWQQTLAQGWNKLHRPAQNLSRCEIHTRMVSFMPSMLPGDCL